MTARGVPMYRCNPGTRKPGTGPHVQTASGPIDEFVTDVIIARLSCPDALDLIAAPQRVDVAALRSEAKALRRNLNQQAADQMAGLISRDAMIHGAKAGQRRLAEITAAIADAGGQSALAPFITAEDVRAAWEAADLPRQRVVITEICEITLHPAGRGRRTFDPELVEITPRA
jgi:site-specific DNA recombinase